MPIVALPAALAAQTGGRGEAGAEYYDDSLPGLSAKGLFAEVSYFPLSGGVLEGTFHFLLDQDNNRKFGRNAVAWREIPFSGSRLSVAVGDLSEFLDRPSFRFTNDLASRPLFRGVSLTRDSESLTISVFGGRNERLVGSRLPNVEFAPESFVGAAGAYNFGENVRLDFSTLHVRNERPGAPSLFGVEIPDRAHTYEAGLTASLSKTWRVAGRASYSLPDYPAGSTARSEGFLSYAVGGIHEGSHLQLEANYLRYGAAYVPLSTIFIGNREGPFVRAAYRTKHFFATGAFQRFENNRERNPAVTDFRSTFYQFSSSWSPARRFTLTGSYADQKLRSASPLVADFGQKTASLQALISTYGFTRLRYQYQENLSPLEERKIRELEVEHYLTFRLFSLSAGVRYQRDNHENTSTLFRGGLDGSVGPVRLFLNGEWGKDLTSGNIFSVSRSQAVNYGASVSLPYGFVAQVEGYRNRTSTVLTLESMFVNPDLPVLSFNRSTLLVRLVRSFRWGNPLGPRLGAPAREKLELPYGIVQGTVFSDSNANGIRDPGEPAVAGSIVRLDDGRETRTDVRGSFIFPNVIEGSHRIEIVIDTLPAAFNPPALSKAVVEVRRLAAGAHDFGLIPVSRLVGRVEQLFRDGTRTGFDGAVVTLLPNDFSTYTDEEGNFEFANLAPGSYKIRFEEGSLPEGAKLETGAMIEIAIAAGQDVSLAPFLFSVLVEERPVKKVLEQEQTIRPVPKSKKPGERKPQ